MRNEIDLKIFEDLQKADLSSNEAKVYYSLIQHGKKGTIVDEIRKNTNIVRTTIYSVLKRLLEMGLVFEKSDSTGPKGAKMFTAKDPELFFNEIIRKKKKELEALEHINKSTGIKLKMVYLESSKVSEEMVDIFVIPYLKDLLDNGWQVIECIVEKSKITHGFEAYDLTLLNPNAKFVKDAGFLVFKYDRIVENDENTLNYMYETLKIKGKEEILKKDIGVEEVILNDTTINLNGNRYQGFLPKFRFIHDEEFREMTEAVMIPIKDKIFFLWAENHQFITEMTEKIFKIERISQDS
ncbi:MAG: hypothetical protein GF383_01645 [Candidatus Lokiarchaeota archaeon]|nr:hypothetical protein [Candidatus Lokiarchaeota archaeon]